MTAPLKTITWAIAVLILGVMTILWSWNTIAELVDGPVMQAKHATATLLLLGLDRTTFLHRNGNWRRLRRTHGHEN